MVPRKKTDVVQLSKIRMREALRARLASDAEKKGVTLNAEIVDRLEQSYANEAKELRDSAIVDMLVDNDSEKGKAVRLWASEIVRFKVPRTDPEVRAERIRKSADTFRRFFNSVETGKEEDK